MSDAEAGPPPAVESAGPAKDYARPVERIDAGAVVLHIERGELRVVMPLTAGAAMFTPVAELAQIAAIEMVKQQEANPGRNSDPIELDDTPLALRPRGADEPLNPAKPILEQTPGHWRAEDLPLEHGGTARLPVGAFELIDLRRRRIVIAERVRRIFTDRAQG